MNILAWYRSIQTKHSPLIGSFIRSNTCFGLIPRQIAFLRSAWRSLRHLMAMLLSFALIIGNCLPAQAATQVDIVGPTGSGAFGTTVTVLPNGNIVVTDPLYDLPGGSTDVGAAYLFQGSSGALISMLVGSRASDKVGHRRRGGSDRRKLCGAQLPLEQWQHCTGRRCDLGEWH